MYKKIEIARGCDTTTGDGDQSVGLYSNLRETSATFPSRPTGCDNNLQYRSFYYTVDYILMCSYNIHI